MTRRFFLFDTVSGVPQNDYPLPGEPSTVRYPNKMTIEITMDEENEEMIYVPILRISYRERTAVYIKNTNAEATVEFSTYYISSTESFWNTATIIFYICLVICIIIVVIKVAIMVSKPTLSRNQ